jgi:hypothetical protein
MKKKIALIGIIGFALCFVFALAFLSHNGAIGVAADKIEQDARKSQRISELEVSKSISDRISAMIFYNDTLDGHTFSIYVNDDGLSYGYHFRKGGSHGTISYGIVEFKHESYGSAIISMNEAGVARIEFENGIEVAKIDIDPAKPFSVVIPGGCGSVSLYDVDGSAVSVTVVDTLV